jgi:putative Mg2+ transporter-C (MgtC) family protein
MTPVVPWSTIAFRLALSIVAGALMGLDRSEHGRPAGLRTTLLVCLSATVAMIQANVLLSTTGKAGDSFVTLDPMRLPLGILTGMGFIGGGAILRRDGFVLGVTTAATLWFVTVIGLSLGGGQLALGIAALALGMVVLSGLRVVEQRLPRELHGTLRLTIAERLPTESDIRALALIDGYGLGVTAIDYLDNGHCIVEFDVQWRGAPDPSRVPSFIDRLLSDPGVTAAQWRMS